MIINREQLSAFYPDAVAEFAARLTLLLLEQFEAARQQSYQELHIDIQQLIPHAVSYGLTSERDAAAYVITAFVLGEDFVEAFPAAQQVLTSPVLVGADKAQWLKEWTTALFQTMERKEE